MSAQLVNMPVRMSTESETDELYTVFHRCTSCDFERVPRYRAQAPKNPLDERLTTARFCPGCGALIDWSGR